jgi:hypothetical protein
MARSAGVRGGSIGVKGQPWTAILYWMAQRRWTYEVHQWLAFCWWMKVFTLLVESKQRVPSPFSY